MMAVQASVSSKDVAVATALVMFSITMGGALFLSVTQNVFTNRLVHNLIASVPELQPRVVIETGATNIKSFVTRRFGKGVTDRVLIAYNDALTRSWNVALALTVASFIGIVFYEWKNIRAARPDDEERAREDAKAAENASNGSASPHSAAGLDMEKFATPVIPNTISETSEARDVESTAATAAAPTDPEKASLKSASAGSPRPAASSSPRSAKAASPKPAPAATEEV